MTFSLTFLLFSLKFPKFKEAVTNKNNDQKEAKWLICPLNILAFT